MREHSEPCSEFSSILTWSKVGISGIFSHKYKQWMKDSSSFGKGGNAAG